jgi:aryl-alcohol dehydrogenase-like predicted oxidoreductase
MEFRQLGGSGLKVPALSLGTATFGGADDKFWSAWGRTDVAGARNLIAICLEGGMNLFDTANAYSGGKSEEVLGSAIAGIPREKLLISTKAASPTGTGPNDFGTSRHALIRECDKSLRRIKTDYVDVYYTHGFDATTSVEETLRALDDLVSSGKVRYIACSNFSAWHLMKSVGVSDRNSWSRYVAHQVHYCLDAREFEWELMPLALDQNVGTVVWSGLAGGALAGNIHRSRKTPVGTRMHRLAGDKPAVSAHLYDIVETLDRIATELEKTMAQVALNWLLQRPTVASVVIGASNENQLKQNLGAVGWKLTEAHVAMLDRISDMKPPYPYWTQRMFPAMEPPLVTLSEDWAERFPPPMFIGRTS